MGQRPNADEIYACRSHLPHALQRHIPRRFQRDAPVRLFNSGAHLIEAHIVEQNAIHLAGKSFAQLGQVLTSTSIASPSASAVARTDETAALMPPAASMWLSLISTMS